MRLEVVRDNHGFACAIAFNGTHILHLVPGSQYNEENVDYFVAAVNQAMERAKGTGDTIRSVVDRVLWTANASDDNKRILTGAIAEELCHSKEFDKFKEGAT